MGNEIIAGMITETEAYCGPHDLASHASRGRTLRTEIMFGPAGRAYIYLIYGMYYCFNIVTEINNYPAAVLIRAVLAPKMDYKITNGPGKVCRVFHIDKQHNGLDITKKGNSRGRSPRAGHAQPLHIEDRGIKIPKSQIKKTPRIGVDFAGKYKEKKWRFVLKSPEKYSAFSIKKRRVEY